jgi:hypothetical protein
LDLADNDAEVSMLHRFVAFASILLTAAAASAQPQLSVSQSEVPSGGSITVTVTGTPGLLWALVGSRFDNGLVYGGVALSVGPDVQILGSGFFDPSGMVTVPFTPPLGNGHDVYYLQAVSSSSPSFLPPSPSNAIGLRPRGFYTNTPTFAAGLSAGAARITNVATPTTGTDAATKAYVDQSVVQGYGSNPVFVSGLSAGGALITNVATPVSGSDAATKNYVDTSAVRLTPPARQLVTSSTPLIDLEQRNQGDLLNLRLNTSSYGTPLNMTTFRMMADSGFLARGVLGVGQIPMTGAGERMMWHPNKGAFRAGSIGSAGTQWDEANVGYYTWAGGYNTIALGLSSFAMGYQSQALGSYSTAVGYSALADGTGAVGLGYRATACADYSMAFGQRASTASAPISNDPCAGSQHAGAITFADGSTTAHVGASANNQFTVRAAGGYRLFTNATTTTGVSLNAGGSSWNVISDRNAKYAIEPVDEQDLLRRLMTLPLNTFLYKDGDGRRYVGPMAQDFHQAFGFGTDDTRIAMNDIDGVSLAALKALGAQVQTLRDANARLAEDNARVTAEASSLRTNLEEVLRRLSALEQQLRR